MPSLFRAAAVAATLLGATACADGATEVTLGPLTGQLVFGVTSTNRLVAFDAGRPSELTTNVAITGLAASERIVGLDVRPVGKVLVGLGSSSRLYVINPTTGAAMPLGTTLFATALAGASFGFDFNPTVDRVRSSSDADQNLRLHPELGTVAVVDVNFAYGQGDAGAGRNPAIVAMAYTNSMAGATSTTLFAIDSEADILASIAAPNGGVLTTVGPLGVNTTGDANLDISPVSGVLYASLTPSGTSVSRLYRVDPMTGTATVVGAIGGGVTLTAMALAL